MALIPYPGPFRPLAPWAQDDSDSESSCSDDGGARRLRGDPSSAIMPLNYGVLSLLNIPNRKLKTVAAGFTFVAAAGYISVMAAAGLLAILITGAVVIACVLATIFITTTLIALIVGGVPISYAIFQYVALRRQQLAAEGGGRGGGGGGGMFG